MSVLPETWLKNSVHSRLYLATSVSACYKMLTACTTIIQNFCEHSTYESKTNYSSPWQQNVLEPCVFCNRLFFAKPFINTHCDCFFVAVFAFLCLARHDVLFQTVLAQEH